MSNNGNGAMTIIEDDESLMGKMVRPEASVSTAIQLAAAMLDKRITTARQFPRNITRFKKEIGDLLREDIETARSAEYAKPVGGGVVKGPSVRLAELALLCWGNAEIGEEEAVVGDKSVSVKASAWDLERNIRQERVVSTSIIKRDGTRYPGHMIEQTCGATASKARRNAICSIIPRTYINNALEVAKAVAAGTKEPLDVLREKWLGYCERTYKVTRDQVFAFLGVAGVDDIAMEHIDDLKAISTGIKDGETTVAEVFATKPESKTAAILDKLKERQAGAKTAPEPKPADKPLAAGELDALTSAIDDFRAAGGIAEELAEANKTTLAKMRESKGKAREIWAALFATETELLTAAKGKAGGGSLPGMSNEKSGASK